MPETTKGEDIANVFMEHFEERGIDISKIFAVTTDGAPAMVGRNKGAVTLIEKQIFSHMKSVLSPSRSRLTTDHSEACVQLKVTKYDPQIMELSKGKQGQGSH
ncbi:Protein ZBED8 [Dissostichus eleginoides]|uniref:Protein ZBED8 n=1 Tax=Dissostichus eleginoides TaxID=100907 RepID=A0AAD9BME9_DISEL|nr:Protein ZBED8 [Dissostichus eleginoides]